MSKKWWAAPVTAVILAIGFAAPANASETSAGSDEGRALINGQVVSDPALAQRLIEAYWTPERMRSALPVDKPVVAETPELEQRDRPGNIGPERSLEVPVAPSTAGAQAVNASPGVGKVFFKNVKDGKNYVCSGSTINNPTKNMVSTAGHCVHGGKNGDWHENWAYVPYYNHGATPYGTWAAHHFTSVKGWTNWSYSWWDFGFVNVWPNNGIKLVHKTGGNAISFNYPKNIAVTLLAYPSAAPFDGQWQHYCQGNMYKYLTQQVGFNCLLTGGASGGPFLRAYDNTLRFGYTNSVIAHGPDHKNYGPYFDNDVLAIYNLAKNKV